VAFGTAKDMLEAVRRLQAVPTGADAPGDEQPELPPPAAAEGVGT